MRRTLVLSLLVVGAVAALAVGSYTALAGAKPVTEVARAVVGAAHSDEADVVVGAEDAPGDVDGDSNDSGGDDGAGARDVARVIAEAFGSSQGEALALHEQGIGFGALFKLYALAAATETTVDDLLATIPIDADGRYDFRFGELRQALTEEQQAVYEAGPKNVGQLVSSSNRLEHAGADADAEAAAMGLDKAREKFAAHASNGHGPPDHAPAHGRN